MSCIKMDNQQSVSDYIDGVLEEGDDEHGPYVCLQDVSSSHLKNHQTGNDSSDRLVYITADIYSRDLDRPNNDDVDQMRRAQELVDWDGYKSDEPGLIIPKEFGGTSQFENIYPKSKFMDTTVLDNHKEGIREHLTKNQSDRHVQLTFALKYNNNSEKFSRPFYIYYRFRLYEKGAVVKEITNKLVNVYRAV